MIGLNLKGILRSKLVTLPNIRETLETNIRRGVLNKLLVITKNVLQKCFSPIMHKLNFHHDISTLDK